MEIITSALPSGRAITAVLPDKGRGVRLQSSEEVGRHIHNRRFHMLPLKTQFPLQPSRLQSIYRSTLCTRFQEGPGSWSLSPLPLLRVGLAPGPPQTLPPGCFVIAPHALSDRSFPCPPGSFSLFRSHWSFTPLPASRAACPASPGVSFIPACHLPPVCPGSQSQPCLVLPLPLKHMRP